MTNPIIFDIKRYAINDGPGIRTTIFFSGCPLHCVWCHNPESWELRPHKTYKATKCIGCGSCIAACQQRAINFVSVSGSNGPATAGTSLAGRVMPVEGVECLRCGQCADACPTLALEMCGREWTFDELMAEIEKERIIMEDSGGGVTLCGGEPLLQHDAALAVLRELGRRGLHRTVDTTLYAAPAIVEQVARHCELMLVDLKIMDCNRHQQLTGVKNDVILSNIHLLAQTGTPFFLRIPLIDGVNADDQNIEATARFAETLLQHDGSAQSLLGINLLPYHDVGRDKHRRLWTTYNPEALSMSTPSDELLQHCASIFAAHGLKATVGG